MGLGELVYLDGRFMDFEHAAVSIDDRGYQFGDGVYEVVRFYGGVPFELERHLDRLERSASGILLQLPRSREELAGLALECVARAEIPHAILYIQVTRGKAPRKHAFPPRPRPTLLMTVREAPEQGAAPAGIPAISVPDERWANCHLKTINLLPNVLAKEAAWRAGAREAVFVRDGVVTEGASSNVFAVVNGEIHTCPADNRILAGITRAVVMEVARELGLEMRETELPIERLRVADEVFLTGTTVEVLPVVSLDGKPVGRGVPGEVTRALQAGFNRRVESSREGIR